jgi:DNA-directed RNA polymerase specialized sigma24 family protein
MEVTLARDLTKEAFDKLLSWLSPDRDTAARGYELHRRQLVTFFRYHGFDVHAEDMSDVVFNRVAAQIADGREIRVKPSTYLLSVAGMLSREGYRNRITEPLSPTLAGQNPPEEPPAEPEEKTREEQCVEEALNRLSPEERDLYVQYCEAEGRDRIRSRKRLSIRLGLEPKTLRVRVHRIRRRLERWAVECFGAT